ncbi:GntR family transcriptional regulator [Cryobacterium sp. MLB-32]|nr:GntR family transcriptional regulator [Cryobacterium sp. MLB-32]KFF58818.1 GntR family transcriptional regulator [Cryobacterium sp. MLB-32]
MIVIDTATSTAPFEQIRRQLRQQILAGELIAGTRLPTVRRLAADLGVATNTVARAYKELEVAGFVVSRGRAGTMVAANGDAVRRQAHAAALTFALTMKTLDIAWDDAISLAAAAYAHA